MKSITFAVLFTTICNISTVHAVCQSVMGGCAKDATHDTSSHMKSQIVNKVIHEQSATSTTNPTSNSIKNSKMAKSSGKSLVQTTNKVSVR